MWPVDGVKLMVAIARGRRPPAVESGAHLAERGHLAVFLHLLLRTLPQVGAVNQAAGGIECAKIIASVGLG